MSNVFSFDLDSFPVLQFTADYLPGYSPVSLAELDEEGQGVRRLIEAAGTPLEPLNEAEVLTARTDADGVLVGLYGIEVCRLDSTDDAGAPTGSQLVLRVGKNAYPVILDGGDMKVGAIAAAVDFTEKETLEKKKYVIATATFISGTGDIFYIPVRLDKGLKLDTPADIALFKRGFQDALRSGNAEKLGAMLAPMKGGGGGGGGGNTVPMQDLGLGEFVLERVTELKLPDHENVGETRVSFVLHLGNGMSVWAKGQVAKALGHGQRLLQANWVAKGKARVVKPVGEKVVRELEITAPISLIVSEIRPLKNGGTAVTCRLVDRYPAVQGAPQRAAIAAAPEVVSEPTVAQGAKSLIGFLGGTEVADDGDLPF